jgi:MFS transporter, UMF1 family
MEKDLPRKLLRPGVGRGEAFAWASLDFANSGYTTVVLTAVFNAYFVATVMQGRDNATLVWTLILSVSYLIVMVSAPILGAYADLRARKKQMLVWTTLGCVLATSLLATVGPEAWLWAAVLLIVSNFCYATNQDLVAAFLPEIAKPNHIAQVSGYGWAWGFLGGLAALALSLVWVGYGQSQSFSAQTIVGGTMLLTAALFAIAALPSLMVLRDRATVAADTSHWSLRHWLYASWGRLIETWRHSSQLIDLRRFLVCVLVYHAGVQTVITLAAVYAQQVMGFTINQTILLILIVNITAAIGAWLFGYFQDRLGHAKGLSITLFAWIAMVIVAWLADTERSFWVAANFAGLAMGASQSGARAAIAYLSRPGREAETFGLWGVSVNCAAILGPLTYGLVTWMTNNSQRTAMLVTGLFFVAGLFLLTRIDFERGRHAARTEANLR